MDTERKNGTTLKGNPFTLIGPEIILVASQALTLDSGAEWFS